MTSGASYRQAAMQAINRDVKPAEHDGLRKSTTYELEMDMPNPVATTEEIFKGFQNDKQDIKLQQVLIDSNNFQSNDSSMNYKRAPDKPLKTLILGVVYRFTPMFKVNFMPKWVEVTSLGITYYNSASSDLPQAFFPIQTVSDISPIVLLKAESLLNKYGSGTK